MDVSTAVWRVGFVVLALVGCVATVRWLSEEPDRRVSALRAAAVVVYAAVAVLDAVPGITSPLGLRPIEAEALLLVLLVALGHALVWRYLVQDAAGPG